MPQVDLETLVSVCGAVGSSNDRKIASVDEPDQLPPSSEDPPQSFCLSQDAEIDWLDRNAVLERKDSTKGNNSNSTPSHLSNSQRLVVKKSILALPKPKRSVPSDVKFRRNRSGLTLFPRRSASTGGKYSTVPAAEPASPKVSCMGRVRSKRDKNHRQHKTAISKSEDSKTKKKGFWKSVGSFFRSRKHQSQSQPSGAPAATPVQNKKPVIEPAGLLATKRFVSGRKSDSWIGNLDPKLPLPPVNDLMKSESLDCDCEQVLTLRRQRSVGPLSELNGSPDCAVVGPVQA